ncbi:MAG: hypothetical protein ACRERC_15805 [Candidatus Binatia bacterium]
MLDVAQHVLSDGDELFVGTRFAIRQVRCALQFSPWITLLHTGSGPCPAATAATPCPGVHSDLVRRIDQGSSGSPHARKSVCPPMQSCNAIVTQVPRPPKLFQAHFFPAGDSDLPPLTEGGKQRHKPEIRLTFYDETQYVHFCAQRQLVGLGCVVLVEVS